MTRLAAHGVGVLVPAGWEAELSTQPDASTLDPTLAPSDAPPLVVLHAANFALPAERGDYGSGAVQTMGRNSIFAALVEFDPAATAARIFASGIPARLTSGDFAPDQLHLAIPGQSGLQHFFSTRSRAFCLYAVIGSHSLRDLLVPELNRLLSGVTIS